jgi:hypothetical protein
MKTRFAKISVLLLVGILILVACGSPGLTNAATQPPISPTSESLPPAGNISAGIVPVTGVQHKIIPNNLPLEHIQKIGDYDSSTTAKGKTVKDGDRFTFGQYERPFNANTMDTYYPYLDIQNALIFQDDTWIFGVIDIKGPDTNKAFPGNYALQLDTNLDGKGDWLIIASKPASTDWTTNGVQVWQDTNGDVGAQTPLKADENATSGNGFETKVFDSGQGNDPDTAWVRISPDSPATIEIAVKRSLINDNKYLVNMWAGTSLNPALFDFNDHMTQTQAGAAEASLENFYPIKGLAELDNTCSMAIGFDPTGDEPGICSVFIKQKPHSEGGAAPAPGVPAPPPPPPPPPSTNNNPG